MLTANRLFNFVLMFTVIAIIAILMLFPYAIVLGPKAMQMRNTSAKFEGDCKDNPKFGCITEPLLAQPEVTSTPQKVPPNEPTSTVTGK